MALKISQSNDKRWIPRPKDAAIRDSSGASVWKRLAGECSVGNAFLIPCTASRCRFIFLVQPLV